MSPLRRWGAPTLSMAQLQVKQHPTPKHTELVTGASWSSSNELVTVADDKAIWMWNVDGEPMVPAAAAAQLCTEAFAFA